MSTLTLERTDKATAHRLRLRFAGGSYARHDESEIAEADGILPAPPRQDLDLEVCRNNVQVSTELKGEVDRDIGPLIRLNPARTPQRRFEVLQQWEGVVTRIEGDAIWADIADLTDRSCPTEIVEIPFDEIPRPDHELIAPGCVFYWIIGYETSPGGQIRRVSEIRVRRTPEWSRRSIDAIQTKGRELFKRIIGNVAPDSTTAQ